MEVIFRPQGTRQRSPASCATSCVMASPREVRVNYIRNSKTSLMWCCDTAEGFFFRWQRGQQVAVSLQQQRRRRDQSILH